MSVVRNALPVRRHDRFMDQDVRRSIAEGGDRREGALIVEEFPAGVANRSGLYTYRS